MQSDNLIKLTIGAVLGVMVMFYFAVPLLADSGSSETTFTNDEYFITMDKVNAEDTHTITWEKTNPNVIVVDDVEVTPDWNSITIFAEEDNLLRCTKATTGYYLNFVGATQPTGYGNINDKSISVTIANGTITFNGVTSSDNTYTTSSTFTVGYLINPNNTGAYSFVLKTPDAKAYVLGDSEIYGIGFSNVGGVWQNIFTVSGTIADGIEVNLVSTTLPNEPVISNETTVYSSVAGYKNLYQFEKETFTASYDGTDTPLTYSYVIVPSSVAAEKNVHLDDASQGMVNIIPIVLMAALLLGIVAYAVRARLS